MIADYKPKPATATPAIIDHKSASAGEQNHCKQTDPRVKTAASIVSKRTAISQSVHGFGAGMEWSRAPYEAMSSPSSRSPLQEQSKSEINRLGIRIVPYSPPRIAHGQDLTNLGHKKTGSNDASIFVHYDRTCSTEAVNRVSSADDDSYTESGIYRPTTASSCSSKRAKRVISVHPDKTFTVIPQPDRAGPSASTAVQPNEHKKRQLPQIPQLELGIQFPESAFLTPLKSEPTPQSSPWNYDFVGGVRKVKKLRSETSFEHYDSIKATSGKRPVSNSSSMHSSMAASFATTDTNVKVIGSKNDARSSHPRPTTGQSEPNFIQHGSLHSYPSFDSALSNQIRASYSKESLKVAPLRLASTSVLSGHNNSLEDGEIYSDLSQDIFARHPWAAPLSTIFSDSEEGSDRFSRSLSPTWTDVTDRRQSKQSRMDTLLSEVSEVVEPLYTSRHDGSVVSAQCMSTQEKSYELDEVGDILTDLKVFSNRNGRTINHISPQNENNEQTIASTGISTATNMAIPSWAK